MPHALAQFGVIPSPPPVFVPDWEGGTFNRDQLAGFFRAAALGRVDIVCIGDSNQLLLGHGWDEAYNRVVSDRWGMYATGLVSAGENGGNGAGVGWSYQGLFPPWGAGFTFGGVGPPFDVYMNASVLLQPLQMLALGAGQSADPLANLGLTVNGDSPLDVSAALRYWVAHATFPVGSGAWLRPSARLSDVPYTELVQSAPVDASTGNVGVDVSYLDLPAAPRQRGSVTFRPTVYGEAFAGPFIQYYGRVENTERARGASVHTLYGFGGQSARDMGEALWAASDGCLTLYFSMVRALQGPSKAVLVRIGTGVNDRSETLASLGPSAIVPGNAPAAFSENLRAITDRVRSIWTLNGWAQEELYFLYAISTPIAGPEDDSLLQSYRDAADALSLQVPRSAVTHFERLTAVSELKDNGWLLFGVEVFHLKEEGHLEMARRELGSAGASAGWSDGNLDGVIDGEDLYHQHEIEGNAGVAGGPGVGVVPAPLEPTSRMLMKAVRWDERADMASGR